MSQKPYISLKDPFVIGICRTCTVSEGSVFSMNLIEPMANHGNGYSLKLANGQAWQLIATEDLRAWIERLVSIMELKPCSANRFPRLLFQRAPGKGKSEGGVKS